MRRVMNVEDEWDEEEGPAVKELGRRMVKEELLMAEEAVVKERWVPGREYTTLVSVSKNSIVSELSQIQPFSLYLDLAKCNLD